MGQECQPPGGGNDGRFNVWKFCIYKKTFFKGGEAEVSNLFLRGRSSGVLIWCKGYAERGMEAWKKDVWFNCRMTPEVEQILLSLNRDFYTRFGRAFALTRQRIQPGVRRVLECLPDEGLWLDLGCGNGALALAWLEAGRKSRYIGLDVSEPLLREAQESTRAWLAKHSQAEEPPGARVSFLQGDLGREDWAEVLESQKVDGVLAFAVLHHLPGEARRLRFVQQVRSLLSVGGWFVFSVWQVKNSPRLMQRCQPWERIGLTREDVEDGDMLLDWRYALPGQEEQIGLRYVHGFEITEIEQLARSGGFEIMDSFESDGHGGRLGWYHLWRAAQV